MVDAVGPDDPVQLVGLGAGFEPQVAGTVWLAGRSDPFRLAIWALGHRTVAGSGSTRSSASLRSAGPLGVSSLRCGPPPGPRSYSSTRCAAEHTAPEYDRWAGRPPSDPVPSGQFGS